MFRWRQELDGLRKEAESIRPSQLLSSTCPDSFASRFDDMVRNMASLQRLRVNLFALDQAMDKLISCDITRDDIHEYCFRHLDDEMGLVMPYAFMHVFLYVFRPEVGITFEPEAAVKAYPSFEFDEDGLLVGPEHRLQYERQGILAGDRYFYYGPDLSRYNLGLSNGFIEHLLAFRNTSAPRCFGIAIDRDLVLDCDYRLNIFQRAHVRGPKKLSAEVLQNPRFPEKPSGTVTEHERLEDVHLKDVMFLPVRKVQVMWSARDEFKTVQMEELVPGDSRHFTTETFVANRHVHAL